MRDMDRLGHGGRRFPDLNAPTVVVMTEAPGMAPRRSKRWSLLSLSKRQLTGPPTYGGALLVDHRLFVVWVEFDWNTDIYIARQIVKRS